MSLSRRFAAALVGILLLQFTLLGTVSPCDDIGGRARQGQLQTQDVHAAHGGCDTACPGQDCRSPWTPGQCATMAHCAFAAIPAIGIRSGLDPAHIAARLVAPSGMTSRAAAAPELPPPRG